MTPCPEFHVGLVRELFTPLSYLLNFTFRFIYLFLLKCPSWRAHTHTHARTHARARAHTHTQNNCLIHVLIFPDATCREIKLTLGVRSGRNRHCRLDPQIPNFLLSGGSMLIREELKQFEPSLSPHTPLGQQPQISGTNPCGHSVSPLGQLSSIHLGQSLLGNSPPLKNKEKKIYFQSLQ